MVLRLASTLRGISLHTAPKPKLSRISSKTVTTMSTANLAKLRSLMKERNVDIYVVPSVDDHASEYIADCDGRREFISRFTGSAGVAVVATDAAALATDGRYFNQASTELDENWTLLKQGLKDVPTWQGWAAEQSKGGKIVAVDPLLVSAPDAQTLASQIEKAGGGELKALDENLIDLVWGKDRPARPSNPLIIQPAEYSGKTIKEKLVGLREELKKRKSPGFFVTMLDEVAWLYNLRGTDIPYNPVFYSYASITPTTAALYIDQSKLDDVCTAQLAEGGVDIKPYESFLGDVKQLYQEVKATKQAPDSDTSGKFIISNAASWAVQRALGGEDHVDVIRSPIADVKAVKNEAELEGMRNCHIRDGAALIEYFAWLEDQLVNKKARITEAEAADKLEEIRSKKPLFKGLSFPTISSTGPNAAIMHYKPEHDTCAVIDPNAIYLCDSGAQYHDGTTDVTRTFHFGQPTDAEIEAYTRVLKGLIGLDRAVFPKGTNGTLIDCLARQHLWRVGLDFRHGTGHGVGSYLNVHEGPMGIGYRPHYAEVALAAGQVLSNEPGYYEDGSFGIRIENIIIVKNVETKLKFGDQTFLGFENVTVAPYSRKLIDMSLITQEEKEWLNANNKFVLEKTKGVFDNDPLTKAWLERETQPY